MLAAGRPGEAVALFMRLAGSSDEQIDGARSSTYWPPLEALAHTLAYDAALYGPPPVERLAANAQPTLVMTGGDGTFFAPAADAIAESIPGARRLVVQAQGHVADPKVIAPILRDFFID